jgi:hypothetical protein
MTEASDGRRNPWVGLPKQSRIPRAPMMRHQRNAIQEKLHLHNEVAGATPDGLRSLVVEATVVDASFWDECRRWRCGRWT